MNPRPTRLWVLAAPLALLAACASEPAAEAPAGAPAPAPAPVSAPAPVPTAAGSTSERAPVHLTLRQAQQRLADKGYDPGPADGVNGRRTMDALRRFQRDQGLMATGRLDSETMNRLGR